MLVGTCAGMAMRLQQAGRARALMSAQAGERTAAGIVVLKLIGPDSGVALARASTFPG